VDGGGEFGVELPETEKDKVWLAELLLASVTRATNENWPVCVVDPLSWPPLLKLNPEGSDPEAMLHW
jgi:hypothetical protein